MAAIDSEFVVGFTRDVAARFRRNRAERLIGRYLREADNDAQAALVAMAYDFTLAAQT